MKTLNKLALLLLIIFFGITSSAMAYDAVAKDSCELKVAVVDIPQIIQKSPQLNALNIERNNKLSELETFVLNARKDVAAQKTDSEKKALEEKYNKELNQRKENIDKDYTKKLAEIDKDITNLIKIKAKKLGFDLTLTKNVVLDGGIDITADIIKDLK